MTPNADKTAVSKSRLVLAGSEVGSGVSAEGRHCLESGTRELAGVTEYSVSSLCCLVTCTDIFDKMHPTLYTYNGYINNTAINLIYF